ncbi:MAG: DUF5982 domain-containing protein [Bacteroidota bacterium]|nr:DUF5982 domain-containing protein [Bacteroidota bacterium]
MKNLLILFLIIPFCTAIGQTKDSIAKQNDTTKKLPFAIAKEKRMTDEDIANKPEGTYVTGVPDISSDPVNGFGYGVGGYLYFNGKKTDPFFNYTPYRAKIDIALFNTTKSQREIIAKLDVPYILNSKWRLRVEGGYESNPNLLYFGKTESTLNKLSYYDNIGAIPQLKSGVSYSEYSDNFLVGDNKLYHNYNKEEFILNISGERSLYEGKMRLLLGYELASVKIRTFQGNSLLQLDANAGQILGLGSSLIGLGQVGIIYDTRDLESDPSKGIFAELTNELSLKALGSSFNFNKTYGHISVYKNLIAKYPKRLVLAGRAGLGYTAWDAPFFEYQDQWSSEGSVEGLGGSKTLRGYKQSRFLGRVMSINNLELRYRFAQLNFLKQHFAFSTLPFIDAGAVWDDFNTIKSFKNFRVSEGLGLRIAWNVNTILRFDYAVSQEDRQFFFSLAQMF